jgi:drug/metabolite transporter (DMT)-like permease
VALDRRYLTAAVGFPLLAALLWASYYIFVLAVTPGTAPSAVFVYPFLLGGAAYAVWCGATGHGAAFRSLFRQPGAWIRALLLIGMQLSVLAGTYLAGPVDTSLLSLIGDVVLTPILVAIGIAAYRGRLAAPVLWLGMLLCLLGGGLAIVGNQGLTGVHSWAILIVVAIPVFVAVYFVSCARENERTPASAVVAHSMLLAGLIGLPIALAVPGGLPGLAKLSSGPVLILLATGLSSFFVAPALYFEAIQRVGLVVPPMMMTGIPVFAAILGWGVLGIAIPTIGIIGIPVAVAGSLLALRGESSGRPAPPLAGSAP